MQMIGCLFLLVNIFLTYDVINRNIQSREIEQLKAIRLELVELNKNIKELKK